jgi:CheY-like chemotaxis protein
MGILLTHLNQAMNKLGNYRYGILVADDSEHDRFLLRRAVDNSVNLQFIAGVPDGAGVVAYLRGEGEFADRRKFPIPELLMMLDLNMPRLDGFEVLEWLKTQRFTDLTVVVLTDSMNPKHLKRALDLGAYRFQVKPRSAYDWVTMIHALERYLQRASAIAQAPGPLP